MPQYSKEQILQLYRDMPQELKVALDSDHTVDTIEEISNKYQLPNKGHSALVDSVGQTMMGLLPPDEFEQNLQDLGDIEKNIAEEIAQTVRRFLFYPVRKELSALYQMTFQPAIAEKMEETALPPKANLERKRPQKLDTYREKIE